MIKSNKYVLFSVSVLLLEYIIYAFIISNNHYFDYNYTAVLLLSWVGLFQFVFIIFIHVKVLHRLFDLNSIFIILSFLFNFGQCFLWLMGIHSDTEIGRGLLFKQFLVDSNQIFRSQLFFLISVLAFHVGTLLFRRSHENSFGKNIDSTSIFKCSALLSIAVVPITFYSLINSFFKAQKNGYYSLYYGNDYGSASLFSLFQFSFFICLIALLIGSHYNKKVMILVYSLFSIYMAIDIAMGDRGEWFYKLLILIFMHHVLYKKITKKQALFSLLIIVALLYLLQAIISVRDTGITIDSIKKALMIKTSNPIVSSMFEMGGQMGINVINVNYPISYPFGNTYILSFLAMPSMRILALLGVDYIPLTEWFSSDYLHLNYGAAFTMYSEAIVNTNLSLAPFVLLLEGIVFSSALNIYKSTMNRNPFYSLFCISMCAYLFNMIRNTAHEFFKYWFLGCFPLLVMILVYFYLTSKRDLKYD